MKKTTIVYLAVVLFAATNIANAGLIRYYGLNEAVNPSTGTTAVDSSGNQDGTYGGTTGPAVGIASADATLYGTAASFNGSDDVVNLGAGLGQLTNNFSIAAWIKPEELNRLGYIIGDSDWGSGSDGWGLFVRGLKGDGKENKLDLLMPGQGSLITTDPFITASDIGKWTHVAVTISSTEGVKMYKNGQLFETFSPLTANPSSDAYWIGCGFGADDGPWLGGIDEVRIYDHVLTGGEVAALATIPEPSTVVLMTLGLIGLLTYAWRKQK